MNNEIQNNIILKEIQVDFEIENGSPDPLIIATEHQFFLTINIDKNNETHFVRLNFKNVLYHLFGLPDEFTLGHHRYTKFGLKSYGIYLVVNSEIVEQLNSYYKSKNDSLQHFIFTFHDSTFEIVCESYETLFYESKELLLKETGLLLNE